MDAAFFQFNVHANVHPTCTQVHLPPAGDGQTICSLSDGSIRTASGLKGRCDRLRETRDRSLPSLESAQTYSVSTVGSAGLIRAYPLNRSKSVLVRRSWTKSMPELHR